MNLTRRTLPIAVVAAAIAVLAGADGPPSGPRPTSGPTTSAADPAISRIRAEGLDHSQVMATLDTLCNVIGARLTASPGQRHASEWTRDQLGRWGLANAHLEPWGPFGRGWKLDRFALQVTAPYTIVLDGYPKAWSPGLAMPIDADVVYLDATTRAGLAKYKGQLRGKVVLIGAVHPTPAHFEPTATRLDAAQLAKMAASRPTTEPTSAPSLLTNASTTRPAVLPPSAAAAAFAANAVALAQAEGAALVIDASPRGDGGTLFVAQATVPSNEPSPVRPATGPSTRPRAWSPNAPAMPPQVTITDENFNRLLSLIRHGEHVRIAAELGVTFLPPDQTETANTVAELPGTDLKDQIVMVGGHLDSWQSATGATDNAAGAACAMEAIRILKAAGLHPRRTVRVALWTGEEEGLLGSAAYVKQHFGYRPDDPAGSGPASRPSAALVKGPEYDELSVYFNLDNGTGRVRGIYAQNNLAAVPILHRWLAPFADLSADLVTISNTGSTDHISFDRIGLPGFQFVQDPIEYFPRTHHSNADVYERLQADDLREASTVMAAMLWDAANADERFPRKPKLAPLTGR